MVDMTVHGIWINLVKPWYTFTNVQNSADAYPNARWAAFLTGVVMIGGHARVAAVAVIARGFVPITIIALWVQFCDVKKSINGCFPTTPPPTHP
jgi:hypothetical protein